MRKVTNYSIKKESLEDMHKAKRFNPCLGYVGLEAFEGSEQTGDLFLEYHNLIEILGRCDLAPFTMIRRLRNHIHS